MSLHMNSIIKTKTWLNNYNKLDPQKAIFRMRKKCLQGDLDLEVKLLD